jgi:hypothetical protein
MTTWRAAVATLAAVGLGACAASGPSRPINVPPPTTAGER